MITSLEPIDPAIYHADPCETPSLSSSIARILVQQCPRKAYLAHPRLGAADRPPTKAMDEGTILHRMILGAGQSFAVCDFASWRSKAAVAAQEEAIEEGLVPVLAADHERLLQTATRVQAELATHGIDLGRGQAELGMFWGEGDVQCRGMLDHVEITEDGATILDLKSTRSAHPDDVETTIEKYGYGIQAVAYTRGLEAVRPELAGRVKFRWLFFEKDGDGESVVVYPGGELHMISERRWLRAVDMWAQCLKSGRWPGYCQPGHAVRAGVPKWAAYKEGLL